MIAATNKEKNLELDIRFGSFSIYKIDSLECVCSGTLESFINRHDDMRHFAMSRFDALTK